MIDDYLFKCLWGSILWDHPEGICFIVSPNKLAKLLVMYIHSGPGKKHQAVETARVNAFFNLKKIWKSGNAFPHQ